MGYNLKSKKDDNLDTDIVFTNFHPINDGLHEIVKEFVIFCHKTTDLSADDTKRVTLNFDKILFGDSYMKETSFLKEEGGKKIKFESRASNKFIANQIKELKLLITKHKEINQKLNTVWFDGFPSEKYDVILKTSQIEINKNLIIMRDFLDKALKKEKTFHRRRNIPVHFQVKLAIEFLITEIEIGYINKTLSTEIPLLHLNDEKADDLNLSDLKKYVLFVASKILAFCHVTNIGKKALYKKINLNSKNGEYSKETLDILNRLNKVKLKKLK